MTYTQFGSLSKAMETSVRRYMQAVAYEFLDGQGEVNATGLAEDAAREFDIYVQDNDYTIPEHIFELAYEVAELVEAASNEQN